MSVKLQISLEDIAKQLHDKDSKYTTVSEVLDELYGIGITATNILSLLSGSAITIPDLFKNFKPSKFLNNFMPTKYLNVTKEENAINRYEKLAVNNLSIILVSFNQSVQDNRKVLENHIKQIIKKENKDNHQTSIIDILSDTAKEYDTKLLKITCQIPQRNNLSTNIGYIDSLVSIFDILPTSNEKEKEELIEKIKQDTLSYYNTCIQLASATL